MDAPEEKLQNQVRAVQIKSRVEMMATVLANNLHVPESFMGLDPLEMKVAERIAELSKQGQHATARVAWMVERGVSVFRIQIRLPDGRIESVKEEPEMPFIPDHRVDTGAVKPDYVNHPPHYASHPSGVECVDVAEFLSFNLGNALKYMWRWEQKDDPEENLQKCLWYLEREDRRVTLLGVPTELHAVARMMVRKAIDKEGKSSPLGKFLVIIDAVPLTLVQGATSPETGVQMLGQLMRVVRETLRVLRKVGDP